MIDLNIKNLNVKNNFKYIVHIADIHIPNNFDKELLEDEYNKVLNNLDIDIKMRSELKKNNTCIIIAGDIFDMDHGLGNKLHPNAILMFKNFIKKINKRGTLVLISGNHDNNITHQHKDGKIIDILSSVINDTNNVGKNIFYLKDSGKYRLGNLILYHTSVFDIDKTENYEDRLNYLQNKIDDNKMKHIGILHCGIDGQTLQNGFIMKGCAYKIRDIEKYDICCLGDTHKQQFLGSKRNIGYPNSLVQQNQGESLKEHGYILWNLETFDGIFYDIPNEYGYVTVDLLNEININNIEYPQNSRIKIRYKIEDNLDINMIRKKIEEKTKIISWKEEGIYEGYEKSNKCIDDELSDDIKILDYINEILPGVDNLELRDNILNKLNNDTKEILDIERLSCKLLNLYIEDFQGYKGNHLIDFEKYNKNSSLSIIGNNYSGKSTIIDAIGVSIWGPNSGKGEFLINNNSPSKSTNLKLTFLDNHENKKYKIERKIFKSKPSILILLSYNDKEERWERSSLKKKELQKEIDKYFGKKEYAKQTWFSEQGTFNSFISSSNNYITFQEFIGADKFIDIYNKSQKEKKEIEKDLDIINKRIDKIEIYDINIEEEINKLKNTIIKLKKERDELEINKDTEIEKKQYGTLEDKINWNRQYDSLYNLIDKLKKEIIKSPKEDIKNIEIKLKDLMDQKDKLNRDLPKLPLNKNNKNIEEEEEKLNKIKKKLLQYENINIDDIDKIKLKLDQEKNKYNKYQKINLKIEYKNKQFENIDIETFEKEKLILEKLKNTNLINKIKIDNFSLNSEYKNKLLLDKLNNNNRLVKIQEDIKKKEVLKKLTKNRIINIPEKSEIYEGYDKFLNIKFQLEETTRNKGTIEKDLEHVKEIYIKNSSFIFNHNCKSCIKNNEYLEINKNKELIEKLKKKCDEINTLEQINKNNYSKYSKYEKYKMNYEKNEEVLSEIQIIDNDIKLYKIEYNKLINLIDESEYKIKEYDINYKILKEMKDINKIIKLKENVIKEYEKHKFNYEKNKNEIIILNVRLDEIGYDKKLIDKLEKEYNKLEKIDKLINNKISLEGLIVNIKQNNEYTIINEKIITIEYSIIKNELNKNNLINENRRQDELKYKLLNNESQTISIKEKIDRYNKNGGYNDYNYNNYKQESVKKMKEIEMKMELIGELNSRLETYNKNKKEKEKLENNKKDKEKQLNLLKEYCKIVDPRSGYPHDLIKDNLKIFINLINNFTIKSGYLFKINIKIPEYNADSKKQDNKLNIMYMKNNKIFDKLSGAEMAIFNIGIQTSLGKLLTLTTPPIQIIDEGFSPLDKDHINEIPEILNSIKTQFNLILYISHDEFIKNRGDYCIKVIQDKKGNSSFKQL